jgi:guanylate kinase
MLLMFSGPSTVGKDARWLSAAEKMGFVRVVPYTTRSQRSNEKAGHDYNFISKNNFYDLVRNNQLAEWDYILDEYYGVPVEFEKDYASGQQFCLQIRATMGLRMRRKFPNSLLVMLMTSDPKTLEYRLRLRGYDDVAIIGRIKHGMEEMAQAPLFDLVVPDADILSELDARRILQDYLSSR